MTMRLFAITLSTFLSACCTYISNEDAIQIAKTEINRRNIKLPAQYAVHTTRGTIVTESGPDIPVYVVSFNLRRKGGQVPFYDVELDPCNGEVRKVGDFRNSPIFR